MNIFTATVCVVRIGARRRGHAHLGIRPCDERRPCRPRMQHRRRRVTIIETGRHARRSGDSVKNHSLIWNGVTTADDVFDPSGGAVHQPIDARAACGCRPPPNAAGRPLIGWSAKTGSRQRRQFGSWSRDCRGYRYWRIRDDRGRAWSSPATCRRMPSTWSAIRREAQAICPVYKVRLGLAKPRRLDCGCEADLVYIVSNSREVQTWLWNPTPRNATLPYQGRRIIAIVPAYNEELGRSWQIAQRTTRDVVDPLRWSWTMAQPIARRKLRVPVARRSCHWATCWASGQPLRAGLTARPARWIRHRRHYGWQQQR